MVELSLYFIILMPKIMSVFLPSSASETSADTKTLQTTEIILWLTAQRAFEQQQQAGRHHVSPLGQSDRVTFCYRGRVVQPLSRSVT